MIERLLARLLVGDARRTLARKIQRRDYLRRWENREPGFVRCQECRDVIKDDELHDCRYPNDPITVVVKEP